ncbi:MAG TPA: Zn-ribbon domain-containing OB-fold protein [Hyphomicrobiales bacterium]|nr:Zn-ribbon domain-containing OB-fold protein [Hyphomicrobiales bacterium]
MSSNSPDFSGPGPVQMYQDALTRGQFLIQQCKDCGNHIFYPRVMCNHCGSAVFRWVEPTGKGEVYSTSVVRRKAEKGGDYNVALITLEEGPRMMGRVLGMAPDKVRIGMVVSAHVGEIDGEPAVVFYAVEQGNREW